MSFSAAWLALREPVDHASRASDLAAHVKAHFAVRQSIQVVDLGCGSGSNLRATALLLPDVQAWTLVDYDPALLEAAANSLKLWADVAEPETGGLLLSKGTKRISVRFMQADLNHELDQALGIAPDLVTASALFDLISANWISGFARRVANLKAAFYTVLTYDGKDAFFPPHPLDPVVIAAFAKHQESDKGFGPAAGPQGANALATAFRTVNYQVKESESPWHIGHENAALATQLLNGIAAAVSETNAADRKALNSWLEFRQSQLNSRSALLLTGHRDTFAIPSGSNPA